MEVYIGNLTENVTYNDLVGFFKGFSNKAKFRIVEKKKSDGTKFRYGIAVFDSDKLALKAIKKLDRKMLRGDRVVLREYFYRYYANERRALNWRDKPWSGEERRHQERRKLQNLKPDEHARRPAKPRDEEIEKMRVRGHAHLVRKG